jgi:hypothetical protein
MPARDSRYHGLPDALRPLPEVGGEFRHTLAERERLDHLASRYYRDPRRWWRICDANPEFLSPLELVGAGPLRTLSVPLDADADLPEIADDLGGDPGIVRFRLVDDPMSDRATAVVTYNRVTIDEGSVLALLGEARDASRPPQTLGRAGKSIVVPPGGTA